MAANFVSAEISVFYSKIVKTFPKSSQRFYLAQTLIKNIKTTSKKKVDELFITKQEQKARNKNKIGLPPKKRNRLTPLAGHKARIDLSIAIFGIQFFNKALITFRSFFIFSND